MESPPAAAFSRGIRDEFDDGGQDGGRPSDGPVVIDAGRATDSIELPEGIALAGARLTRSGDDLVVADADGQTVILTDYFTAAGAPGLIGADGVVLSADLAARLAPMAPAQVAQVGAIQAEPIGEVDNIAGTVIATRADGSQVALQPGDPVFQGNVLESGPDGGIGIVFADETSFSMAANGRMVLDELVYDPATAAGSFSISVVRGLFSFVSGQVAKANPDAMVVETPVATIGIRGTQGGIEFLDGQTLTVVTMEELDGFVGEILIRNNGGILVLNQVGAYTVVTSVDAPPATLAFLDESRMVEIFTGALSHLPLEQGNENNYGVLSDDDLAFLDDFETAAGGDQTIVGGTDDVIRVTAESSDPLNPVPRVDGGAVPGSFDIDLGGGGGGGLTGGGGDEDDLFDVGTGTGTGSPLDGIDSQIYGTAGPDNLSGTEDRDFIFGDGGDDRLDADTGDDIVFGGNGDDIVVGGHGGGDDLYFGGNPTADFGLGTNGEDNHDLGDIIVYPSSTDGVAVNLNSQSETVFLHGAGQDVTVAGGFATDLGDAYIDDDRLAQFEHAAGGSGGDLLIGGAGGNSLWGEWDDPAIGGNENAAPGMFGDDTLFGGSGDDVIIGGGGDDVVVAGISAGDGSADDGDDQYFGGFVADGGEGQQSFVSAGDSDGAANTISFERTALGVEVDLQSGVAEGTEIGVDSLSEFHDILGGAGDDELRGDSGANQIIGGAGDDEIFGRKGADILFGQDGVDQLFGGGGEDYLDGGDGDDILDGGDGADILEGGAGSDTLIGGDGEGQDLVNFTGFGSPVFVNLSNQTQNFGGVGVLDNRALAAGETDTLIGIEGAIGGVADDILFGGDNGTHLDGGAGNDTIFGGAGDDTLIGGDGVDTVDYSRAAGSVTVDLINNGAIGDGLDSLSGFEHVNGSAFADFIRGDNGDNVLRAGAGDDLLFDGNGSDILVGGGGSDTVRVSGTGDADQYFGGTAVLDADGNLVSGGDDADAVNSISFSGFLSSVTVVLGDDDSLGTAIGDDVGVDALFNFHNVTGSGADDAILGNATGNTLSGGGGDDDLRGGAGDDVLHGDSGDDLLHGDDGLDTVIGGAGADTVFGTADGDDDEFFGGDATRSGDAFVSNGDRDQDTVDYTAVTDDLTVTLADDFRVAGQATGGGVGTDKLFDFHHVVGGAGNDKITGNKFDNQLTGGAGDDQLSGKGGSDTFFVGLGNDTVDGGSDSGLDTVDYSILADAVAINLSGQGQQFGGFDVASGTALKFDEAGGPNGIDTLVGIESAVGGGGNDAIFGGDVERPEGGPQLEGLAGDDFLQGGSKNDVLDGGDDNDTASFANAKAAVTADLGAGTATGHGEDILVSIENLIGGAFGDTLIGDEADNILRGGLGDDTLTGGGGTDSFQFDAADAGEDTITDIGLGDRISLLGFADGSDVLDIQDDPTSDTDRIVWQRGDGTEQVIVLEDALGVSYSVQDNADGTGKDIFAEASPV